MKNISLLLFIIISQVAYAQDLSSKNPQVKIANGALQGVAEVSGIRSFKGIPFAEPPVGDLRWKEPQAPKDWKGLRMADHFGPQAVQAPIFSDMVFRSAGKSEDCLYLNVWTPAKSSHEKLPVLVYFYGGGFVAGDGSEPRYDGESMAKRGIVSVTINYRLGVFGFLAHPELTKESLHHASGNYGLMDQHAALVWVQKNIAAFGGDPAKVTIAGESAGSMAVCAQVASPLSKGLFAGAIGESGSILGNLSAIPLKDAEKVGLKFAKTNSLADLRKMSADQLLKLADTTEFPHDIDGYFLPESPQAVFDAGKQMDVALLAGWNSAEVDYHSVLGNDAATIENYKKAVQKMDGEHAAKILAVYTAANDADVQQIATDLASDLFISYSTWKFVDMQALTGTKPVYRYLFSRKRPPMVSGEDKNVKSLGASHASEIEYALGNLASDKVYGWTPDDYKASETMESYFANFIKTGNPNGSGLPKWNSLKNSNPEVMVIDAESHSEPIKNRQRYTVLDSIYTK